MAAEVEQPLAKALNLVGRVSAGAYYVDSDIEDQLYLNEIENGDVAEDGDDAIGGRFGAALGFKVPLYAEGVTLTIMGTVDYLTHVATIDHVGPGDTFTKADVDDQFDLGARINLVFH